MNEARSGIQSDSLICDDLWVRGDECDELVEACRCLGISGALVGVKQVVASGRSYWKKPPVAPSSLCDVGDPCSSCHG